MLFGPYGFEEQRNFPCQLQWTWEQPQSSVGVRHIIPVLTPCKGSRGLRNPIHTASCMNWYKLHFRSESVEMLVCIETQIPASASIKITNIRWKPCYVHERLYLMLRISFQLAPSLQCIGKTFWYTQVRPSYCTRRLEYSGHALAFSVSVRVLTLWPWNWTFK